MDEFELIKKYFKPLSLGEGAGKEDNLGGRDFGFGDDAFIWRLDKMRQKGEHIVMSKDMFVEHVHFRPNDPPQAIGEKILRAALSDLAAMGARPCYWLLGASFGNSLDKMGFEKASLEDWVRNFALGCQRAQNIYGLTLVGGDMVRHHGAHIFSVSVLGLAKKVTRRDCASANQNIYVTGDLADSALGLKYPDHPILNQRYLYPEPRLDFGRDLPLLASAVIDLSDGLCADLRHICEASQVSARIYSDDLPFSQNALELEIEADLRALALNAGDDYELLIIADKAKHNDLYEKAEHSQTKLTLIGETLDIGETGAIGAKKNKVDIEVVDRHGKNLKIIRQGFKHFR